MARKKSKVLVLLSGGLDSILVTKILLEQGVDVEAFNFTSPFCLCDKCSVDGVAKKFKIKVHKAFADQAYLNVIANPPHGYGSQMNPCIDCRIHMFKKAKEVAKNIKADFLATGEVLDERPFSQRKEAMLTIEKEAGLEGKVLRPLSARLLPETDAEKRGLVNREKLFAIQGRRRIPQMNLAKELKIKDYPCPAGGCLLTDPSFANKLREYLKHNKKLTLKDIVLLKTGRHFRIGKNKIIVGRNEQENKKLLSLAKKHRIMYFEAVDYMGPVTLLLGKATGDIIRKTAAITVRYSDAKKKAEVKYDEKIITAEAIEDKELEEWRLC